MSAVSVVGLEHQLAHARRNVFLLMAAQAIMGSAGPLSFSVGALAGYQLLDVDKALATAPLTGYNIGVALGAIVAAVASRYMGRKAGFIFGAFLCSAGGGIAAVALLRSEFWLFATGLMLIGISSGFTQKIRFAAADVAPSFYKAKAISWILAGGVVSAIIGPQLAIFGKDLLEPVTFAGAFVALIPLGLVSAVIFSFLKLPEVHSSVAASESPRPLMAIVGTHRFVTGMICGIGSYALMTFMMVGAPLAMVVGCGFSTELASLGIQWHVLAMFAPSFFTGMLVARFSAEKVVAAGLAVLMACAVVAHMGIELWNFWAALILLGVGWNFSFIGATAIVSSSYRPHEADKVQGFHDIVLFGTVAVSSLASGQVFSAWGWSVMNLIIWPVAGTCFLLILFLLLKQKQSQPVSLG